MTQSDEQLLVIGSESDICYLLTEDAKPDQRTHRRVWTLDADGKASGDQQNPDILA